SGSGEQSDRTGGVGFSWFFLFDIDGCSSGVVPNGWPQGFGCKLGAARIRGSQLFCRHAHRRMMRGTVLRGKTAERVDQKRRPRGKYPSRDAEGGFLLSSFSSAMRLPLSMKSPGKKRLGYIARLDPGRTKAVLA